MAEDDKKPPIADAGQVLQTLMTEHFVLQTARSATIADANGRASIFLSSVSSGIVALAFIGQATDLGQPFFVFSLVLFPSLFFLGLVTFLRVLQTAIEDVLLARGINRIRHFYTEIAPDARDYFIFSTHDDFRGVLQNMAARQSWWQPLITTGGTILVVNSILIGVWSGLLARHIFAAPLVVCAGGGAGLFVVSLAAHNIYQTKRWKQFEENTPTMFPTAPSEAENVQIDERCGAKTSVRRWRRRMIC